MIALRALTSMVGLQAGGALLSFGVVLALTAALGPDGYGRYAWVVSMSGMGALFLQIGLPTTIIKKFSPLDVTTLDARSEITNTLSLYAFGTALIVILALMGSTLLPLQAGRDLLWALPGAGALTCLLLSEAVLRAAGRAVLATVVLNIVRPGCLLLGGLVLHQLGVSEPWSYLSLYTLTALGAALVFISPLMLRAMEEWKAWPFIQPNGAHFQVALSRTVASHLPIFITGFFVSPEILAYLAIAIRVTGPIRFGVNATRAYYGAKINKRIKANEYARARSAYRNANLFSVAIAFPASIILVLLALYLTTMSNGPLAKFDNINLLTQVLVLTALSHFLVALFGPVQLVAILLHEERFVRNINLIFLFMFTICLFASAVIGDIRLSAISMAVYSIGAAGGIAWRVRRTFITTIEEGKSGC